MREVKAKVDQSHYTVSIDLKFASWISTTDRISEFSMQASRPNFTSTMSLISFTGLGKSWYKQWSSYTQ